MDGIVGGILASEGLFQSTRVSDLNALKTMGEIQAQPVDMALKQAHAAYYDAEAKQKMQALQAAKDMQNVDAAFAAQQRDAAIKKAASEGRPATTADLKPADSFLEREQQRLQFIQGKVPEAQYAAELAKYATTAQHFAAAAHNNAQAVEQQASAQIKTLKEKSNLAGALMANPDNYQDILKQAVAMGTDIKGFPPIYTPSIRPLLQAVQTQGIDAAKQLELGMKKTEDASQAHLRIVQEAKLNADIATEKVRKEKIETQIDFIKKIRGPASEAAADLKKLGAAAKRSEIEARERKAWRPMPLDPKQLTVGQGYVAVDGTKWNYAGERDGKSIFLPPADYVQMQLDASGKDD